MLLDPPFEGRAAGHHFVPGEVPPGPKTWCSPGPLRTVPVSVKAAQK